MFFPHFDTLTTLYNLVLICRKLIASGDICIYTNWPCATSSAMACTMYTTIYNNNKRLFTNKISEWNAS